MSNNCVIVCICLYSQPQKSCTGLHLYKSLLSNEISKIEILANSPEFLNTNTHEGA